MEPFLTTLCRSGFLKTVITFQFDAYPDSWNIEEKFFLLSLGRYHIEKSTNTGDRPVICALATFLLTLIHKSSTNLVKKKKQWVCGVDPDPTFP